MAENQTFLFIDRNETPISPINDRAHITSSSEGIGAGMSDREKAKIEYEKSETIKDIAQFTLDLTGILDPTPVSDGTNALLSLSRGNWVDAVISVVSIVPFVGDVAKLGKFSRYLESIRKAIKIAEKDGVWAIALTKLLKPLRKFLDQLIQVFDKPPKKLLQIKDEIDRFMASTMDGAAPGGKIVNPKLNSANQVRKPRVDKLKDDGILDANGAKNSTTISDTENDLPAYVFRGDARSPDIVFNEGFKARGESRGLFLHALDNTDPSSAYVSTSRSFEVANDFSDNVYVVKPRDGVDINAVLGSQSPFPYELEIAIPDGIKPSDIRAVTLPEQGVSILNPNFKK